MLASDEQFCQYFLAPLPDFLAPLLVALSLFCFDAIYDVTSSLGDIRTIVDPSALTEIA